MVCLQGNVGQVENNVLGAIEGPQIILWYIEFDAPIFSGEKSWRVPKNRIFSAHLDKKNKPSGRSSAALKSSSAKLVSSPGMHCWPLISLLGFTDCCSLSEIQVLIRYVNVVIQGNDPISYPLISEKMFMLELLFVDRTSPVPSWNIRYTKWTTENTLNSLNVWFRSLNLLSSNFVQRRISIQNTPPRILES